MLRGATASSPAMVGERTCSFTSQPSKNLGLLVSLKDNPLLLMWSRAVKGWKRRGFGWSSSGEKASLGVQKQSAHQCRLGCYPCPQQTQYGIHPASCRSG